MLDNSIIEYSIGGVVGGILVTIVSIIVFKRRKKRTSSDTNHTLAHSLQDEKAKSDIIVNTIEDGVILMDNSRTIQLINPGASKITGWPINDAIGLDSKVIIELVNEKDEPYTDEQNPLIRVFDKKVILRDNQAYLKTHSDKRIAVDLSVTPLIGAKNVATGAVAIIRDVGQARTEEKARAEFISTASHEMRTPVAAIEGYLALAMNDKVSKIDSKAREYLEKAHSSTQHLGKLFQDLLTSAKAEDGRLSSHPVVLELGDYLEHLVEDLRFAAQKKGLDMEFILGTNSVGGSSDATQKMIRPLYYALADPDRLREVITNVFDNAVKYTERGKVSIGLTGDNNVVQFRVSDTGPGIPPEDMPHLFQKFYRVDNSSTRTVGGTGLGLFICRKIVELYNGHIWVESKLGEGSTFFVNLPRLSADRALQLQAEENSKSSLSTPNQFTGNAILNKA
jgi:PAS domain S-box-containing protein